MDAWARDRLIEWSSRKGDTKTQEGLARELDEFAADLAGPTPPSPVERILIETAALCWYALRLAEGHYAGRAASKDGFSLAQSDHAQRRIDRAHRRLLSTLKTLAQVRRLAVPAVQINVARQQVNQQLAG